MAIYPEGTLSESKPSVEFEWTAGARAGLREPISYDFPVNATGPKLNFDATEGLGPGKNRLSVCSADHAEETAKKLPALVEQMKRGDRMRFVVGTGHGSGTCEGAASAG